MQKNVMKNALIQEMEELKQILKIAKKDAERGPEGHLRVSHCGKTPQYYQRIPLEKGNHSNNVGKYIPKKNRELARRLAQKDYALKVMVAIEERVSGIKKFIRLYDKSDVTAIYEHMSEDRKMLVNSYTTSKEERFEQWKNKTYTRKPFAEGVVEIYTNNGERVRSKSEKIIADMLERYHVAYHYECPLFLKGMGEIYPDFTLYNPESQREIYWEHLGMMDNPDYCEKALRKISAYQKDGYMLGQELIITYETSKTPLDTRAIQRIIDFYFLSEEETV